MTITFKITLTAATLIIAGIASDAEARSFGGGGIRSASFSRSFSAPRISAPRANFVRAPITNRSIVPTKFAGITKPVLTPRLPSPINIKLPPNLGGIGTKLPPGLGQPSPLPPRIVGPGIIKPPIGPGIIKPPVGPIVTNPPKAPTPPPITGGKIPPVVGVIVGGGIGLAGALIAADEATASEVVAVAPEINCRDFYVKWQETGDKRWKLAYYECTGDL